MLLEEAFLYMAALRERVRKVEYLYSGVLRLVLVPKVVKVE
jgi:hypothetical protein